MKRGIISITILLIGLCLALNVYAQADIPAVDISNYPQDTKEGYKIFSLKCTKCHSLARPLNAPYSGEAWKTTVYRMMRKKGSFITQREADKIYAFLVQYSSTRKPSQPAVETKGQSQTEAGKNIYLQKSCDGCHTIAGVGGKVGPELTLIGRTRDAKFLYKWIKNPQAVKPAAIMPNLGLTDKELKPLVEYLTGLK